MQAEVKKILIKNKDILIAVVQKLIESDKITPEEFKEICAKFKIKIEVSALSDDIVYWDYYDKFQEFTKKGIY